jgi:hypothetical protein
MPENKIKNIFIRVNRYACGAIPDSNATQHALSFANNNDNESHLQYNVENLFHFGDT